MLRAINRRNPFLYKIYRSSNTVPRNMMPYTTREFDKTPDIILLRIAVCPTLEANICRPQGSGTLAGEPRSTLCDRENICADVLEKWNQRPQLDTDKEWIKYSIQF